MHAFKTILVSTCIYDTTCSVNIIYIIIYAPHLLPRTVNSFLTAKKKKFDIFTYHTYTMYYNVKNNIKPPPNDDRSLCNRKK